MPTEPANVSLVRIALERVVEVRTFQVLDRGERIDVAEAIVGLDSQLDVDRIWIAAIRRGVVAGSAIQGVVACCAIQYIG